MNRSYMMKNDLGPPARLASPIYIYITYSLTCYDFRTIDNVFQLNLSQTATIEQNQEYNRLIIHLHRFLLFLYVLIFFLLIVAIFFPFRDLQIRIEKTFKYVIFCFPNVSLFM